MQSQYLLDDKSGLSHYKIRIFLVHSQGFLSAALGHTGYKARLFSVLYQNKVGLFLGLSCDLQGTNIEFSWY